MHNDAIATKTNQLELSNFVVYFVVFIANPSKHNPTVSIYFQSRRGIDGVDGYFKKEEWKELK